VSDLDTCVLCPRLCRDACPVATGSAREAAVPTWIATTLREWEAGRLPAAIAREAATLCTDCGACRAACHLDRPLPERLRRARAELCEAPAIEPLRPIEGTGARVAVEADERPLAAVLSRRIGAPVRRWPTGDRLGVAAVEHATFAHRGAAIREALGGLEVVVADGGVARALGAAGVPFVWVHDLVPGLRAADTVGSCACGGERPLACCGGAGPLARHHPDDAARVARMFVERGGGGVLADARCRSHLRAAGLEVYDLVDHLGGDA
jgi:hypothetical protein